MRWGFGHTLFGPAFGETLYAGELRKALWECDAEKRQLLGIFGTPLLANLRDHDEAILGLNGAYTFVFMRVPNGAMSLIYSPSTRSLRTVIARDAGNLQSEILDKYGGIAVVLVPGQRRHVEPMPMVPYVLHRPVAQSLKSWLSWRRATRALKRLRLPWRSGTCLSERSRMRELEIYEREKHGSARQAAR